MSWFWLLTHFIVSILSYSLIVDRWILFRRWYSHCEHVKVTFRHSNWLEFYFFGCLHTKNEQPNIQILKPITRKTNKLINNQALIFNWTQCNIRFAEKIKSTKSASTIIIKQVKSNYFICVKRKKKSKQKRQNSILWNQFFPALNLKEQDQKKNKNKFKPNRKW